jgi:hypothetical protein
MNNSIEWLLSDIIHMPFNSSDFFQENEIVPTTILEEDEVKEDTAKIIPLREYIQFNEFTPGISDLIEINTRQDIH